MTAHNLPRQLTPFIGRAQELSDILALLASPDCRLLTLVGPGGMGKTRLALEAARRALDDQAPLADGVFFVGLAPVSSLDFIVSTIAEAVGFQFYQNKEAPPKAQLLYHLGPRAMLLLLDNFEHLLDGADLVSEIIAAAPQVKILATSRERLNLQEEWVLEVGGLGVPLALDESQAQIQGYDAVQLFIQSARRSQVSFALAEADLPTVVRICQLMEGMPLAVELAASWVRALSCADIAAEIERGLDILETQARNMPARHRSIRAVLEHSWRLLTGDEQAVFRRLAVFRGGFTREAAGAAADASLRMLSALVDKSLLRRDADGRYRAHELLRQYAVEQLQSAPDESAAAAQRHARYYAGLLRRLWDDLRSARQREAMDAVEADIENMRQAWNTGVEGGLFDVLDQAAHGLWYYHILAYRALDTFEMFDSALRAVRAANGNAEQQRLMAVLQVLKGSLVDDGTPDILSGLALLRQVGRPEDVLLALNNLVYNYMYLLGWPETNAFADLSQSEVEALAEEGWHLANRVNDRWEMCQFSYLRAVIEFAKGDYLAARRLGEESLHLAEQTGDISIIGTIAGPFLGRVLELIGRTQGLPEAYAEARRLRLHSTQIFKRSGSLVQIGWNYQGLGFIAFLEGQYDEAQRWYVESLRLYRKLRGPSLTEQIALVLVNVGKLWAAQGRAERAVALFSAVIARYTESDFQANSWAEVERQELRSRLSPAAYEAAVALGQTWTLEHLASDIIAEAESAAPAPAAAPPPADPAGLTERELEILGLIADGLSNREIAERLVFALGTVKWYINQIYSKLGVASRTQAVARGRELRLIS